MRTNRQVITIPLDGSRDDKTSRLARGPTVMRHSVNVLHDHHGEARKRRGIERIDTAGTVHGQSPETLFITLGVDEDELVVYGAEGVYTVATTDAAINSESLVYRGPSSVGNYRTGVVHVAPLAEG